MDKPQIVLHSSKSVDHTIFDLKWIPQTPKYITLGQLPNGNGVLEIHSLSGENKKVNFKNLNIKYCNPCDPDQLLIGNLGCHHNNPQYSLSR